MCFEFNSLLRAFADFEILSKLSCSELATEENLLDFVSNVSGFINPSSGLI